MIEARISFGKGPQRLEMEGNGAVLSKETTFIAVSMYQSMRNTNPEAAEMYRKATGMALSPDSPLWDVPINQTTIDMSKLKNK